MATEFDPGTLLVVHKAPQDLLHRALAAPPPRRSHGPLLAVAAALLIGVGLGRLSKPEPQAVLADSASEAGDPVQIVSANTQVPVRLVIHAPEADTVGIAASFNDWDFHKTPMTRGSDGTFHATLVLDRGQHEYMFVVDGQDWVTDPSAAVTRDDGFGNRNALLEI